MVISTPLAQYDPFDGGWPAGAPVPYAHLAAALDVVSATRSRLAKENALTNAMRAVLARSPHASHVEAFCYLLSPAKDAQSGGHRLCPDWHEASTPLGLTHGAISSAIVEATGASRSQLSAAYSRLRDSGDAALAIREGGGRQALLLRPPPLSVHGVHSTLRSLGNVSGTGSEKTKTAKLAGVLRASVGTELKWLVRTAVPHMSCGVSLEASILPALAAAALAHAHQAAGQPLPTPEMVRQVQDAMRSGYALRPDVGVLVSALLPPPQHDASNGGEPVSFLSSLVARLQAECSLRVGVPAQPMLAKPCTSIASALKMLRKGGGGHIAAEHKYDGQRAQVHRLADGRVKLYSRKLDDMSSKYPDVARAVVRAARSARPFIVDAEIVPIGGDKKAAVEQPEGAKTLSTRKRKNVTEANAATSSVKVQLVLFDCLMLGDESMLAQPLAARRQALRDEFGPTDETVAFATSVELDLGGGSASGDDADGEACTVIDGALRRAVSDGCEGLMLKRLGACYEPSWGTRRSDDWVKCKKDYLEGMGDSLDLIPIGGWRGQGRKKAWVSPWLVATYDSATGTFGSVCRVMSGFTDAFYKEQTKRYIGHEFGAGGDKEEGEEEGGDGEEEEEVEEEEGGEGGGEEEEEEAGADEEEDGDEGDGGGTGKLLRRGAAEGVETNERPPFWFTPTEVWEIRGADITLSPTHLAAVGLVHPQRGLSMRFPRFIRKRPDKRLADATTPQQLAAIFRKQAQGQGDL